MRHAAKRALRLGPCGLISFLLFLGFLKAPPASAQEPSFLWGRVLSPDGRPLSGVDIVLTADEAAVSLRTTTDSRGMFCLFGSPWGRCRLRFDAAGYASHVEDGVISEPGSQTYLGIVLGLEKSQPSSAPIHISSRGDFHATTLDADHIRDFPSGSNLWNLVENQDLAATSSRIDVGGMFLGLPAAVSSRGSATWTQTGYRLNGLDVTDPFDTGRPLLYPDVFSLSFVELRNSRLPVDSVFAGANISLAAKEPGSRPRGSLEVHASSSLFAADNVSPALIAENIRESHAWKGMTDLHFELAAPLAGERMGFYASWTSQRITRDLADYEPPDSSSFLSGLFSLEYRLSRGRIRLLGIAQNVHHPSFGAGRAVAPETTLDARSNFGVYQMLWESRLPDGHFLRAGLGYASGRIRSDFQDEAVGPCRVNILPDRYSAAAPFAGQDTRHGLDVFFDGRRLTTTASGGGHLLQYGLGFKFSQNASLVHISDDRHLRFFKGMPLEVVEYNTPLENGQASWQGRLFAQETLFLAPLLSFTAGLNIGFSRGWQSESDRAVSAADGAVRSITWLSLSPHLRFTLPLSRRGDSSLSVSAARYPFALPLNYLVYGQPGALGGMVYAWNDNDQDLRFDPGEAGALIRREGPAFAAIDPEIKQPYMDECVVALKIDLGAGWRLALAGYLRETRNLAETLNTGVPFASYTPVAFHENGDDLIYGTYDDLDFTLYNQDPSTLGDDFFLLTNPEADKRVSRYRGLDVTLVRRHGRNFNMFLSFQAIEAIGTASPGNSEMENDDGVIGSLYDNPNTLICAKGRLRFDRGYTARIGFSCRLPAGFRLASVAKYYDGQPFARNIIVTGFNQGPFFIMAHPRGVARYEFNLTLDLRLEKSFKIGGAELRVFIDGFNLLNSSLALAEDEWTSPTWPLRYATEIQSPRMLRFGLSYDF